MYHKNPLRNLISRKSPEKEALYDEAMLAPEIEHGIFCQKVHILKRQTMGAVIHKILSGDLQFHLPSKVQ